MSVIIIFIALIVTIILYLIGENSLFYADKQDELKKKLKELVNDDESKKKPKKSKNDTPPLPRLRPQLQATPRPRPLAPISTPRPQPQAPISTPRPRPQAPISTPRPRPQAPRAPIKGQLKHSYQPEVKNMVNSFIDNNDKGFKSNLNNYLSKNSTFKATQLTACNTNNPTLDDIICNLKFQYKIQSFI